MKVTGLVPARFLTIISHLVLIIVIFWSRVSVIMMVHQNFSVNSVLLQVERSALCLGQDLWGHGSPPT